jgi:hypothetical protein
LPAYESITNKLNANVELLAGYNSADQTGNVFVADFDLDDAAVAIRSHMKTVIECQRAIYVKMGLMKVMGLDGAEIATIHGDSGAVKGSRMRTSSA